MTVRSLLVTIDPGERNRRGVLYVVSRDPRLHQGDLEGNRLRIETEPLSREECEDVTEQLRQVPGIRAVEVLRRRR